jgi:sodium/potassium/calcium exchanger 6
MILNPPFTGAFLVRFYEDFTATYYYPFGGLWTGQAALVGFICCLPLCYPVWVLTSGPLPNKGLVDVFVVVSFISALFWINVVADELVALLATLGDILAINHAILGLTVLGCGNSMADLAADMSVTRAGFPYVHTQSAVACGL